MDLVELVYDSSQVWPADERFGIVAQIRRAAVSVPSNIAEGNARSGSREFFHHVSIAFGSLAEVETHVLIAARLGYLASDKAAALEERIVATRRPLLGLLRSLRTSA
jgi:four helix bundle protein